MEEILTMMRSPLIPSPERSGEITNRGQVTSVEAREIRNEKTIYMFNVTDFTDTITVKMSLAQRTGAGDQRCDQKGCLSEAERCDHDRQV